MEQTVSSHVSVAFRGKKYDFALSSGLKVKDIKEAMIQSESSIPKLLASDIKLLYKGKDLSDQEDSDILQLLKPAGKKVYKLMATGLSSSEVHKIQESHSEAFQRAPRIRDDLTPQGQREMERRKQLGKQMLCKAATKAAHSTPASMASSSSSFGFGQIEVLPNLPDESKARDILNKLANDPGILACMKKHKWHVGALKEMYPEGKVGESAICVMGLNRNKGQEILLRLRTDDLQGFRKILSVRQVLFHELAHNIHSEHDQKFFMLMRQIERECQDLDWTGGQGLESLEDPDLSVYSGGIHRLGSQQDRSPVNYSSLAPSDPSTARELRAQAALNRMTRDEKEIEQSCGCGREALFLPNSSQISKNRSTSDGGSTDTDMDTS